MRHKFAPRQIAGRGFVALGLTASLAVGSDFVMGAGMMTDTSSTMNWSTLGVVADGVTDNTAALNALPADVNIVGDCPAGKAIVAKSRWLWHSNLNLTIQAGCKIVSYVTGGGTTASYAITQENLEYPLTNVYVTGLQISSYHAANEDIILKLWVNNFTMLHWAVAASGGVMVVRGSNQEIAYGRATGTQPETGNPGIRHVGNEPKVTTSLGRPANVYIHDNYVQSGDAAYQACQPLHPIVWTNVGSDDVLFQNNSGLSASASLILVGQRPQDVGSYTNFSCSNIVFDHVSGSGMNTSVYITSLGASNPVSGVTVKDSVIDAAGRNLNQGVFQIVAEPNGTINNLAFDNDTIRNYTDTALTTLGNVTHLTFSNGNIHTPSNGHFPVIELADSSDATISNSTIASYLGDSVQLGPNGSNATWHPVSRVTITGNTFTGIGNGYAAVRMYNADLSNVTQNVVQSTAGATSALGIYFAASGAAGPGTTNTKAAGNNLIALSGAPKIVFAANQGNSLINNLE